MELFKWIAVIVFVVMGAEVLKYYFKLQQSRKHDDKELDQKLQKLEELEQRIQTLEKIVTDPGENLKREFKNL